jgi:hypothetical protein
MCVNGKSTMTLPPQSISSIAERPHWTVSDGRATFAPVYGGWRAVVSRLQHRTGHARYHVAVIDRTGDTRFTMESATVHDAIRSAERGVLARNALRLVPPL